MAIMIQGNAFLAKSGESQLIEVRFEASLMKAFSSLEETCNLQELQIQTSETLYKERGRYLNIATIVAFTSHQRSDQPGLIDVRGNLLLVGKKENQSKQTDVSKDEKLYKINFCFKIDENRFSTDIHRQELLDRLHDEFNKALIKNVSSNDSFPIRESENSNFLDPELQAELDRRQELLETLEEMERISKQTTIEQDEEVRMIMKKIRI